MLLANFFEFVYYAPFFPSNPSSERHNSEEDAVPLDSTKSLAANVFDILRDLASVDASVSKGRKLGQLNNFVKIVRNVFARNVRLQRQQRQKQQQQQPRTKDETVSQQPSRAGAAETLNSVAAGRDVTRSGAEADSGLHHPAHYGTKPGHFETSIIHFPMSEEVSEQANE